MLRWRSFVFSVHAVHIGAIPHFAHLRHHPLLERPLLRRRFADGELHVDFFAYGHALLLPDDLPEDGFHRVRHALQGDFVVRRVMFGMNFAAVPAYMLFSCGRRRYPRRA